MACTTNTVHNHLYGDYNVELCESEDNYSVYASIYVPNQEIGEAFWDCRLFLERYRDGLWSAVDSTNRERFYEATRLNRQFDNIGYLDTPMRVRAAIWYADGGSFQKNIMTPTWTR